ncbi:hypothetical protein LCGC14_0898360 [marine sediment metagenome]|uniref:Uncharacterized protein n=1 Tax=marine sediment metagenome TaxID=412755 RepID=A0A0F9P1Z8_9ZZZZ
MNDPIKMTRTARGTFAKGSRGKLSNETKINAQDLRIVTELGKGCMYQMAAAQAEGLSREHCKEAFAEMCNRIDPYYDQIEAMFTHWTLHTQDGRMAKAAGCKSFAQACALDKSWERVVAKVKGPPVEA